MLDLLHNFFNVLLIVIGFGLVIFIHELGHFLAAKWAGIRVPAFAIGFGTAICSWRKGMGFRMGSSEPSYKQRLIDAGQHPEHGDLAGVSQTEYRLNWFPFGGYVKMLGQDDLNPDAASSSEGSYTSKSPAKRMVVISAGVVMNILLAAFLFMIVFMFGMRDTPPVIGAVNAGSPAALAGIRSGDTVVAMEGSSIETFTEVMINTAMSDPGEPCTLTLRRPGAEETYDVDVVPEMGGPANMLQIGVSPALTASIVDPHEDSDREIIRKRLEALGLQSLQPGMSLSSIDGRQPATVTSNGESFGVFSTIQDTVRAADGAPVNAAFTAEGGKTVEIVVPVVLDLQAMDEDSDAPNARHLLGLVPLLKVMEVSEQGAEKGLEANDVFLQVGSAAWPDRLAAVKEIQAHRGRKIDLVLLRGSEVRSLSAAVDNDGRIGFVIAEASNLPIVTATDWTGGLAVSRLDPKPPAGTRIDSINGVAVDDYASIRRVLLQSREGAADSDVTVDVEMTLLDPGQIESGSTVTTTWTLTADELDAVAELSWAVDPLFEMSFAQASFIMKADNPIHAVAIGVEKTHWIVVQTYLTFVRLFQGSVRVDNLKGPVGIAHIGSQFASEGIIPLLFFLALISANLAVINFLPIPVVDGGQFVMLLIESITRRPVPIAIQNVATLFGLMLIAAVFLTLTFNDIRNLVAP